MLLGSTGFLGSTLKPLLEASGDVITPSRSELLASGGGNLIRGAKNLMAEYSPSRVVNCVAETDWIACRDHPEESEIPNVRLPEALSLALSENSHLVHVSTDAVFGGGSAPYSIADETCPMSNYGLQKAQAEQLVLRNAPGNVSILRGSFFGIPHGNRTNIFKFLIEALRKGRAVEGYSDFINNPVSVHTFTQAITRVLDFGPIGLGHLGTERGYSKFEFACVVARSLDAPEDLIGEVLSPPSSVAFGGLDLTLESEQTWSKLAMRTPEMLDEISSMHGELKRWAPLGN